MWECQISDSLKTIILHRKWYSFTFGIVFRGLETIKKCRQELCFEFSDDTFCFYNVLLE